MSALSSLLVQDKIVSVSTIEEALQRQVIFGGQLDTNLLELRAVEEQILIEYKARVNSMACATREEIDGADIQAIQNVPREISEKYTFVPLRFLKDAIRVAVCHSPHESRLAEAASILGVALEPVMTSEFRLRMALNKHYGAELPSRFSRLASLLAASPPRVQSRRVTGQPPSVASGSVRRSDSLPHTVDRQSSIPPGGPQGQALPYHREESGAQDPADLGLDLRDTYPGTLQVTDLVKMKRLSTILALPAGLELIEQATTREDVFDASLRVIGGMVEYAAVFVVKGNVAHGKAAWGRGTSTDELIRRPVLLEKPGALWTVKQTNAHYLGPLPPSRANDSLLEAIGRSRPATVIVVPVVLRNRTVVLIYADSGARGAIGYELAALLPLASAMASTFERLIIERKKGSIFSSAPPPPPSGFSTTSYVAKVPPPELGDPAKSLLEKSAQSEKVDTFRRDGSDSGVAFTDSGNYLAAYDSSPPTQETEAAGERHDSNTSNADSFLADGSSMTVPPFQDHYVPSTPDPSSRSSDGVLILLTEVLGDPQERTWETREEKILPDDGERPTDKDYRPAGAYISSPTRPYEPPDVPTTSTKRVHTGPSKRRARRPISNRPREPAVARPGELDSSLPRGFPDPRCLDTAIEPESVEVLPGPEFLVGMEEPGLSKARETQRRRSVDVAVEIDIDDDALLDESRRTPLEVALTEASQVVVKTSNDVIDEGIPIDFEDPVVAAKRTALPKAASASGETRIRKSRPQVGPPSGLPKVIVDMGSDIEALVGRALSNEPDSDEAVARLKDAGEAGLPSLIRRFPGEVMMDWESLSLPVPRPSDHGRLLKLLQSYGTAAMPYLVPKLHSADRTKRFYAVLLLGEIDEPEALEAVGHRLLDYETKVSSLAAMIVARSMYQRKLSPSVYKSIRSALTDRQAPEVIARRAAEAAGVVRDRGSVPPLVDLLRTARGAMKQIALNSLRLITGQDLGSSARRWSAWWGRARHLKRPEWLIDALDHRQERVRALAAAELTRMFDRSFGFEASSPRKEREAARRKCLQWWQNEGQSLFRDLD